MIEYYKEKFPFLGLKLKHLTFGLSFELKTRIYVVSDKNAVSTFRIWSEVQIASVGSSLLVIRLALSQQFVFLLIVNF